MITNDQIIAAARALHAHIVNRSGRGREWEQLPPSVRDQFREEARIVLTAADAVGDSLHCK